ncbi:histidine phosphatase superfamily [Xylariaceae sp. FL0594]|nr:histidine phosphatase superfamily [Xylariaceae sp. FL0594]
MRLLLIRHGESVDNVANLYAGSRDSTLTSHGVLQAKRLGAHIAARQATIGPVRHVFASTLQRAYMTAQAIADACCSTSPVVRRLDELREKDFGSLEGKKFGCREDVVVVDDNDAETREAMRLRIDRFLDVYFHPIVEHCAAAHETEHDVVVIVAHGIILNVLVKALMFRYPPKSSSSLPDAETAGWRNTGVMQMRFDVPPTSCAASSGLPSGKTIRTTIEHANNLDHLQGLKKTRGGIGSAKFDSRQRTVDSFFVPTSKKRKSGDAVD